MEDIFIKLDKYLFEKTIVIFGVNMLFKQDCSIDGFNLKEFASNKNCLYIPIKINDFYYEKSYHIKYIKSYSHKEN